MPTKHQVIVIQEHHGQNESASDEIFDDESTRKIKTVWDTKGDFTTHQDESRTINKKYDSTCNQDKNEGSNTIQRKTRRQNNKTREITVRTTKQPLSPVKSNAKIVNIDRNKDGKTKSYARITRSQSRALYQESLETELQNAANPIEKKAKLSKKIQNYQQPKSKFSTKHIQRKNLQLVTKTRSNQRRKNISNIHTEINEGESKNENKSEKKKVAPPIPKHILIPDRVPSPVISDVLDKENTLTKESFREQLSEGTDDLISKNVPKKLSETSSHQLDSAIDPNSSPSNQKPHRNIENPDFSNPQPALPQNQNWFVPNESTLKMIENEKKMLEKYLESKKVMNQRFLNIIPKPSTNISLEHPHNRDLNMKRQKKLRGSYKCGVCGAMKKDHVCVHYVIDKSTQTEPKVFLTDEVKVIYVSENKNELIRDPSEDHTF